MSGEAGGGDVALSGGAPVEERPVQPQPGGGEPRPDQNERRGDSDQSGREMNENAGAASEEPGSNR